MADSRYPGRIVHILATCALMLARTVRALADDAITESRARLERRLAELTPAVEEAGKIKAALDALNGGPRTPVTVLDMLKPSIPPPTDET
jgi:hypothetical protein